MTDLEILMYGITIGCALMVIGIMLGFILTNRFKRQEEAPTMSLDNLEPIRKQVKEDSLVLSLEKAKEKSERAAEGTADANICPLSKKRCTAPECSFLDICTFKEKVVLE